jgi:fructose-specific phosphotransferase system component IIB
VVSCAIQLDARREQAAQHVSEQGAGGISNKLSPHYVKEQGARPDWC